MPIRRVLTLSILLLSSPLLAQPHRPNPPASAASLLPHLQDLAAAFWARVVGIPEKGGSGLDPNGLIDSGSSLDPDGLTSSSTPSDGSDSGSKLDPNGKT